MAQLRFSPTKLDLAKQWLRDHMEAGTAYRAGQLQQQAALDGIKTRTLQLAAQDVAVIERQFGEHGITAWHWRLK